MRYKRIFEGKGKLGVATWTKNYGDAGWFCYCPAIVVCCIIKRKGGIKQDWVCRFMLERVFGFGTVLDNLKKGLKFG